MQHVFSFAELPKLAAPNNLFDSRYIHSENMTAVFNVLKAGATIPVHQHVQETIDFVMEGKIEMMIDSKINIMEAGMVCRVPSNVIHSAKALSDCKVINIFYPGRDDFK